MVRTLTVAAFVLGQIINTGHRPITPPVICAAIPPPPTMTVLFDGDYSGNVPAGPCTNGVQFTQLTDPISGNNVVDPFHGPFCVTPALNGHGAMGNWNVATLNTTIPITWTQFTFYGVSQPDYSGGVDEVEGGDGGGSDLHWVFDASGHQSIYVGGAPVCTGTTSYANNAWVGLMATLDTTTGTCHFFHLIGGANIGDGAATVGPITLTTGIDRIGGGSVGAPFGVFVGNIAQVGIYNGISTSTGACYVQFRYAL